MVSQGSLQVWGWMLSSLASQPLHSYLGWSSRESTYSLGRDWKHRGLKGFRRLGFKGFGRSDSCMTSKHWRDGLTSRPGLSCTVSHVVCAHITHLQARTCCCNSSWTPTGCDFSGESGESLACAVFTTIASKPQVITQEALHLSIAKSGEAGINQLCYGFSAALAGFLAGWLIYRRLLGKLNYKQ